MLRAVARTFNAIFKGGYLSRQDWLFRYVSFWYEDDVETMSNTCRLRALLIGSAIQTLFVLAFFALVLAVIVFIIAAAISEPALGVWIVLMIVGVVAAVLIGSAAADRWPLVRTILDAAFKLLVALCTVIVLILFVWVMGYITCDTLEMGYLPAGAEMGIGIVAIVLIAVAAGGCVLLIGILLGWFRRFQAWAAETGFWLWLKGWACQELELVD